MAPVEHLVADASALLRAAPLQEIGRRVYTTREVLAEIRDRAARRRLAGLPFQLLLRQPFPEHVRLGECLPPPRPSTPSRRRLSQPPGKPLVPAVTEFSQQTGDFRSLSAADIQVLALTLQLEAEHGGGRPLRTEPRPQTKCPGNKTIPLVAETDPGDPVALAETEFSSFLFWRNPLPNIEEDLEGLLEADPLLLEAGDPEGQESSEESSKEDGWITPRNIEQIQQSTCWGSQPAKVQVGCITTDFAMQNVLLQMGLHVLAFNGLLIQQARSYILRCHGCFRTTSTMTRLFCPHCGNKTLKKVAVTVKDDGSFHLHFSQNPKVLNPRGLRHSLPAPQGGKHASNPRLTEDQRFPQQRLSRKARQKTNAFDPDYVAGVSPFAEHDIHSRAANLQIRDAALGAGRRRLNPNMSRKKFLKNK
ncbi:RNA-binding protein NOB1 isoform 2-T2 [Vipera latastei]